MPLPDSRLSDRKRSRFRRPRRPQRGNDQHAEHEESEYRADELCHRSAPRAIGGRKGESEAADEDHAQHTQPTVTSSGRNR